MRVNVKYKIIYRHKDKYSISEMCRFFGVSRSGYYVKRMDAPTKDLPLAEQIRACQAECRSTYLRRVIEPRGDLALLAHPRCSVTEGVSIGFLTD